MAFRLPDKGAIDIKDSGVAWAIAYFLKNEYDLECNPNLGGNIRNDNFIAICWNHVNVWTVSCATSMPKMNLSSIMPTLRSYYSSFNIFNDPLAKRHKIAIETYDGDQNSTSDINYSSSTTKSLNIRSNNPCGDIEILKRSQMQIPIHGYIEYESITNELINYLSRFGYKKLLMDTPNNGTYKWFSWYTTVENQGYSVLSIHEPKYGDRIKKIKHPNTLYNCVSRHNKELNLNNNKNGRENVNSKGVDESINRRKRITRNSVAFGGCGVGFEAKHRVRRKASCKIGQRKRSEGNGIRTRRGVRRFVTI
jgi:hypothetical protein